MGGKKTKKGIKWRKKGKRRERNIYLFIYNISVDNLANPNCA